MNKTVDLFKKANPRANPKSDTTDWSYELCTITEVKIDTVTIYIKNKLHER